MTLESDNVFTVVALIIAACSLAATSVAIRRKASTDYTAQLESQINHQQREIEELKGDQIQMSRQLEECKHSRLDLQNQNFTLLMKLYQIEGWTRGEST